MSAFCAVTLYKLNLKTCSGKDLHKLSVDRVTDQPD